MYDVRVLLLVVPWLAAVLYKIATLKYGIWLRKKMAVSKDIGMLQAAASDHIPNDIVFCILTYLPVKSLIRFKTVSKSWNDLIADPRFVLQHHLGQPSSKLLVSRRYEKHGLTRINLMPLTFNTTSKELRVHPNVYKTRAELYLTHGLYKSTFLMGPCFGVFCFGVYIKERPLVQIGLINIATGEKKVGTCLNYEDDKLHSGKNNTLLYFASGFGCVHNNTISTVPQFKAVMLAHLGNNGSFKCLTHVYTSITNSWKLSEPCEGFTDGEGTEVKGVIHWPNYVKHFILTFDLEKEVFGRIEKPPKTYGGGFLLTKQDDQYLSLIATSYTNTDRFLDIWVMYVGGCWVRQARVGPSEVSKKNILSYWHNVGGLLWKVYGAEDDGIVMTIGDNRYKLCGKFFSIALFDYVESLASLNF